jgi:hypothetical protein
MAGSIREALEQAFDDHESGTVETDTSLRPIVDDTIIPDAPSAKKPNPYSTQVIEGEGANDDEPVVVEEPVQTPSKLKPEKKAGPLPAAAKSPAVAKPDPNAPAAAAVVSKAPQSWKPAMREQFTKLPAEMQQEILRRESETGRALSESAAARKFNSEFSQVIRPFEALIAGSGVHPLKAVQNLMSTAATLQTGTSVQKAGTIANIIRTYGVDIPTLDKMLAGQKPKENTGQLDEAALQRAIDARLQNHPVITAQTRAQKQQEEQMQTQASQTAEEFAADPKNEYYEDLREDMADLLDMAANRGRLMSIQEAYDRAASAHPEISKLVAKKQAVERAKAGKGNVERARRAASSQGQGTPANVSRGGGASPKGIRASVSQAWDDLSATT